MSLEAVADCLSCLRPVSFATEEDSTGSGNATRTPMLVVFWATDNDELAQGLAQRLVAGKDTVLVSVRHAGGHDRHDLNCYHEGCESSGLVDVEFLGLADHFVGSAGSTYSYMVHARALLPPRYASFARAGEPGCEARACASTDEKGGGRGTTEAGLLIRHVGEGPMHSRCSVLQARATIQCESVFPVPGADQAGAGGGACCVGTQTQRKCKSCDDEALGADDNETSGSGSCLGFSAAHVHIGKCLQEIVGTGAEDGGRERALHVLHKYAVHLNHALMLESFFARYGYFFESTHAAAVTHHLPRCLLGREFEWKPHTPPPLPRPAPGRLWKVVSGVDGGEDEERGGGEGGSGGGGACIGCQNGEVDAAWGGQRSHAPSGVDDGTDSESWLRHQEADEEDQTVFENVVVPGLGWEAQGGIAVVTTRDGFVSRTPEHAIDGERGLEHGAWVLHGDLQGGFGVIALPGLEHVRVVNVFSGVGLAEGHVAELRLWVTDSEHDAMTGHRLVSADMLALKAEWTEVELVEEDVVGRALTAGAGSRMLVRGVMQRSQPEWLSIRLSSKPPGAKLQHGVAVRGVKLKVMASDAANSVTVISEIELLAQRLHTAQPSVVNVQSQPSPTSGGGEAGDWVSSPTSGGGEAGDWVSSPTSGGGEAGDWVVVVWPRNSSVLPRPSVGTDAGVAAHRLVARIAWDLGSHWFRRASESESEVVYLELELDGRTVQSVPVTPDPEGAPTKGLDGRSDDARIRGTHLLRQDVGAEPGARAKSHKLVARVMVGRLPIVGEGTEAAGASTGVGVNEIQSPSTRRQVAVHETVFSFAPFAAQHRRRDAGGVLAGGGKEGVRRTVVFTTISPNVLFLVYQVCAYVRVCVCVRARVCVCVSPRSRVRVPVRVRTATVVTGRGRKQEWRGGGQERQTYKTKTKTISTGAAVAAYVHGSYRAGCRFSP